MIPKFAYAHHFSFAGLRVDVGLVNVSPNRVTELLSAELKELKMAPKHCGKEAKEVVGQYGCNQKWVSFIGVFQGSTKR